MGSSAASQSTLRRGATEVESQQDPSLPTAITTGRSPTLRGRYTRSSKQRGWAILVQHLLCVRHFAHIISLDLQSQFYHLHFIEEETEAHKYMTCPKQKLDSKNLGPDTPAHSQVPKSDRGRLLLFSATRLIPKPRGSWDAGRTRSPE